MLGQIEILLAFTAVMAAVSLVITVCNQAASALLNLRGISLRSGLATAFKSLFPEMRQTAKTPASPQTFGDYIANAVLVHPLICDSALPGKHLNYWRVASALRRDELRRVLAVMASPDKGNNPDATSWTNEDAISWLSRRVALMDDWFEAAMDRVSQHFALYMRVSTVVFAAVITLWWSLDSVQLYRSLTADVKLRNEVLSNISALQAAGEQIKKQDPQKTAQVDSDLNTVNTEALGLVAQTLSGPIGRSRQNPTWYGQLVTVALLSLGAPFWFNQLKTLSNLRSAVAAKEESERQKAAASSPTTSAQPSKQVIAFTAERNEGEVL